MIKVMLRDNGTVKLPNGVNWNELNRFVEISDSSRKVIATFVIDQVVGVLKETR